jgi:hypothetical protein
MLPTYRERNEHAEKLAKSLKKGADGNEKAMQSFRESRWLAMFALGRFDARIRSGDISPGEYDCTSFLDFIETAYDLCFGPGAQVPNGAYYHRRGLEQWMHKLAADKEAKAS